MSCRFTGIVKVPDGSFLLYFDVNGQDKEIFCDSIEELMETVLTEDEYNQWIDDGILPLVEGKDIYDEIEFAKLRLRLFVTDEYAECFKWFFKF